MHLNPVEERVTGAAPDLTIVLMHGRGQTPADMVTLSERLALDNVRYLFPRADDKAWYPDKFMAPIANNEPYLSGAIARYEAIVSELIASGTPSERIVLGGFSQGACLSAEYLARHPRRYAAAALWTGGLIGPRGTVWPLRSVLRGMPAFITTAENDAWVPAERVRETYDWMAQSGAEPSLKIYQEREHGVLDEEVDAVRAMIARVRLDHAV